MEDKENEEYKKRIKKLIERVEKNKDNLEGYQRLLEKIEAVKQSAILGIDDYRSDISMMGFATVIKLYQGLNTDPNSPYEQGQFRKEIDSLFHLIYEELKKPSKFLQHLNPNEFKHLETKDRKDLLIGMRNILGAENFNHFYKKFKIRKLVSPQIKTKIKTIGLIVYFFIFVSVMILIAQGIVHFF